MNTNYNIIVLAINEREAKIEHEKNSSKRNHRFYEFREESSDLPVIRLSIDTPLYRVANYRTNILQLRWIKSKNLSTNFFLNGEENESVQKVQHEFLWDLAQTEKESLKSIAETLEEEKQREPILITSKGVVVNGNRRLAAMRELSFSHVDCMVLPSSANEDDLKDIEVRLQMTPQTRLPYGWINECIAIKDLNDRGRDIVKIGELMRLDPIKVKDKLLMLTEINLYLKDWKNADTEYDQLNDAEEIISQVTKRINKKDGTSKEISRHIAWVLLDQRGNDGRIYDLRDTTGNLTQSVVDKLQEVYSSEMVSETNEKSIELEFEFDDQNQSYVSDHGVLSFLKTLNGNEAKQVELVNFCRAVVETKKNKDIGNAALKAVIDAHTKLIEVDLTSADSNTFSSIKKQFDKIERRIQYLKTEISKYEIKSK